MNLEEVFRGPVGLSAGCPYCTLPRHHARHLILIISPVIRLAFHAKRHAILLSDCIALCGLRVTPLPENFPSHAGALAMDMLQSRSGGVQGRGNEE